jgi:hypothetical protein
VFGVSPLTVSEIVEPTESVVGLTVTVGVVTVNVVVGACPEPLSVA